jgi:hypothetical protein
MRPDRRTLGSGDAAGLIRGPFLGHSPVERAGRGSSCWSCAAPPLEWACPICLVLSEAR